MNTTTTKTPEELATLATALKTMSISEIAALISKEWRPVWFGAVPYLDAMLTMQSIKDPVWNDSGRSVVNYFISNAKHWRGEVAKLVKAELKDRVKNPR